MVNIQKIQQVSRIPSRSQEKNTTGIAQFPFVDWAVLISGLTFGEFIF